MESSTCDCLESPRGSAALLDIAGSAENRGSGLYHGTQEVFSKMEDMKVNAIEGEVHGLNLVKDILEHSNFSGSEVKRASSAEQGVSTITGPEHMSDDEHDFQQSQAQEEQDMELMEPSPELSPISSAALSPPPAQIRNFQPDVRYKGVKTLPSAKRASLPPAWIPPGISNYHPPGPCSPGSSSHRSSLPATSPTSSPGVFRSLSFNTSSQGRGGRSGGIGRYHGNQYREDKRGSSPGRLPPLKGKASVELSIHPHVVDHTSNCTDLPSTINSVQFATVTSDSEAAGQSDKICVQHPSTSWEDGRVFFQSRKGDSILTGEGGSGKTLLNDEKQQEEYNKPCPATCPRHCSPTVTHYADISKGLPPAWAFDIVALMAEIFAEIQLFPLSARFNDQQWGERLDLGLELCWTIFRSRCAIQDNGLISTELDEAHQRACRNLNHLKDNIGLARQQHGTPRKLEIQASSPPPIGLIAESLEAVLQSLFDEQEELQKMMIQHENLASDDSHHLQHETIPGSHSVDLSEQEDKRAFFKCTQREQELLEDQEGHIASLEDKLHKAEGSVTFLRQALEYESEKSAVLSRTVDSLRLAIAEVRMHCEEIEMNSLVELEGSQKLWQDVWGNPIFGELAYAGVSRAERGKGAMKNETEKNVDSPSRCPQPDACKQRDASHEILAEASKTEQKSLPSRGSLDIGQPMHVEIATSATAQDAVNKEKPLLSDRGSGQLRGTADQAHWHTDREHVTQSEGWKVELKELESDLRQAVMHEREQVKEVRNLMIEHKNQVAETHEEMNKLRFWITNCCSTLEETQNEEPRSSRRLVRRLFGAHEDPSANFLEANEEGCDEVSKKHHDFIGIVQGWQSSQAISIQSTAGEDSASNGEQPSQSHVEIVPLQKSRRDMGRPNLYAICSREKEEPLSTEKKALEFCMQTELSLEKKRSEEIHRDFCEPQEVNVQLNVESEGENQALEEARQRTVIKVEEEGGNVTGSLIQQNKDENRIKSGSNYAIEDPNMREFPVCGWEQSQGDSTGLNATNDGQKKVFGTFMEKLKGMRMELSSFQGEMEALRADLQTTVTKTKEIQEFCKLCSQAVEHEVERLTDMKAAFEEKSQELKDLNIDMLKEKEKKSLLLQELGSERSNLDEAHRKIQGLQAKIGELEAKVQGSEMVCQQQRDMLCLANDVGTLREGKLDTVLQMLEELQSELASTKARLRSVETTSNLVIEQRNQEAANTAKDRAEMLEVLKSLKGQVQADDSLSVLAKWRTTVEYLKQTRKAEEKQLKQLENDLREERRCGEKRLAEERGKASRAVAAAVQLLDERNKAVAEMSNFQQALQPLKAYKQRFDQLLNVYETLKQQVNEERSCKAELLQQLRELQTCSERGLWGTLTHYLLPSSRALKETAHLEAALLAAEAMLGKESSVHSEFHPGHGSSTSGSSIQAESLPSNIVKPLTNPSTESHSSAQTMGGSGSPAITNSAGSNTTSLSFNTMLLCHQAEHDNNATTPASFAAVANPSSTNSQASALASKTDGQEAVPGGSWPDEQEEATAEEEVEDELMSDFLEHPKRRKQTSCTLALVLIATVCLWVFSADLACSTLFSG